ncbi:(deoxy)nucleoside triphosphate pyrophosphohydrolase [Lactobacillus sp. UCMA15818]|uniref:(deoxy)nucleoside triphosphate pyrophosphohydrolase n=1 Tax=Lactobacillus sp. UCMA15818 TaxID=2583394 RepID=UPI0025B1F80F|nr:(deoxy)nucleoside triphosphate pyrophosphohydrolase [Lactobacillus sp. UCMA15818]MDN2453642.1 (deoxy)nucleoside triphosphate pyrophosphohydrolase [Lactobacillus sp. UCMA15818]
MKIEIVCAVILNRKKQIFVGKRKSKKLAGYWEFPGGKIEKDEGIKEALKREVMEEIGAEITIGSMVVPEYAYHYQFGDVKLYFYFARLESKEGEPKIYEEYGWLPIQQLENKKWLPANQKVLAKLSKWDLNKVEFDE